MKSPAIYDRLVSGPEELRERAASLKERAKTLRSPGPGAADWARSLGAGERVLDELVQLYSYLEMRLLIDAADEEAQALAAEIEDPLLEAAGAVTSLVEAWKGLDATRAARLAAEPQLAAYERYLWRSAALDGSAGAEDKEASWQEEYEALINGMRIVFDAGDGEQPHSLQDLFFALQTPDRELRLRALEAAGPEFCRQAKQAAACLDGLVSARLQTDEQHGVQRPLEVAAAANEVDVTLIEQLLETAPASYLAAHRWCLTRTPSYQGSFTWTEAAHIICNGLARLSPKIGEEAGKLFEEERIDALPRSGKSMGSCCVSAGSGGAYIVTHFRGDYASLFELAHEVGHACHAALAADQGRYYSEPSQLCGEIAALFAELMVLDEVKREQIKRGAEDPEIAALLHWEVDHFFRNYFGQLRLTRFELHLYQRRAGGERLNSSWLDQAWRSETELLYGGEVPLETLLLGSEWLVFQRHLSEGRLYSWTYPWALSAAVALRARLLQGKLIESDYLAFLAAGSARPTQELLGSLALDSGPRLQEEAVAIFQERLGELEHLEQRDGDIAHQA